MLVLLKTYLDIIALRKGPDAVPASWLVLYLSLAILAFAWLFQVGLADDPDPRVLVIGFAAYLLTLLFFGAIVYLYGFSDRLLQTLSSIIACGSLIAVAAAIVSLLLGPMIGSTEAGLLAALIWFWSVPVKGHIIARSIEQHWFVGIAFAVSAFILRLGIETAFSIQT